MTINNNILNFIQKVFPMPMEKAEAIASLFHETHLSKNELFLTEGKICTQYGFLDQGLMRSFTYNPEGVEITTGFFAEQQVACEIFSFFKKTASRENIQAATDCIVWTISYDQLQQAFHSMPEFREFGRTILVNAYAQLKERMLSLIQETAEQRYSYMLRTNPHVFKYVSLKHIATYLGITDTSLSRIRKEYAKSKTGMS